MSDLIDRQAVLDWLKNEWNGMVTSLFDGIKALPSTQPERTGRWVPCEKDMPPKGVDVWVTTWGSDVIKCLPGESVAQAAERIRRECRRVTIAMYADDSDGNGNTWAEWFGMDGYPMMVRPVAWMPLDKPEPYKEGEGC